MNIDFLPYPVLSLRLYGSFGREDFDGLSDVDVLAVYETQPSDTIRSAVRDYLLRRFSRKVDLAEYARPRIEEFFKTGHLFAWHLYAESSSLAEGRDSFFDGLGPPAPYGAAHSDALGFLDLLRSSTQETLKAGVSLVYEAGLMYLASRNIGICTSYSLSERPDFSRYAIYEACRKLKVGEMLAREEYDRLIHCRFASIRGLPCIAPSQSWISEKCDILSSVCADVINRTFQSTHNGTIK